VTSWWGSLNEGVSYPPFLILAKKQLLLFQDTLNYTQIHKGKTKIKERGDGYLLTSEKGVQ
jgi:hypothetical protein